MVWADDGRVGGDRRTGKILGGLHRVGWRRGTEETTLTGDPIQGREGVVIVKTTQAMLVTHYPETVQPGAAANTVEQLADYLIKVGY